MYWKKGIFVLLFIILAACSQTDMLKALKRGFDTCQIYKSVHQKGLVEITQELLASKRVHPNAKQSIIEKKRRIFLFEYPSDGMQIKGYISFVPNAQDQNLLVFLRGGSSIYEVKSPIDQSNFWGDHTIICSTYRGGPSPGRDEFGGRDVADVKHLIDYVPILEEKLGICFSQREQIAVGFSRGGMQLFLALQRFPELAKYFDRAVTVCGVLDLEEFLKENRFMAGLIRLFLFQKIDQSWKDVRNPIKNCGGFPEDLPLLVIQGTQDHLVDLQVGKEMVRELKSQSCKVTYREKEGATHCDYSLGEMINEWLDEEI